MPSDLLELSYGEDGLMAHESIPLLKPSRTASDHCLDRWPPESHIHATLSSMMEEVWEINVRVLNLTGDVLPVYLSEVACLQTPVAVNCSSWTWLLHVSFQWASDWSV